MEHRQYGALSPHSMHTHNQIYADSWNSLFWEIDYYPQSKWGGQTVNRSI